MEYTTRLLIGFTLIQLTYPASLPKKSHNDLNIPDDYIFPPGVTLDWFKYQGRSKENYERVVKDIYKYKRLLIRQTHPDLETKEVEKYVKSEPPGILDDMIMNPDQIEYLLKTRAWKTWRKKRNIIPFKVYQLNKWNNTIPFKIDNQLYTDREKEVIRKAISFWNDTTCLNFVEYEFNAVMHVKHLLITKGTSEQQCASNVGVNNEESLAQQINLGSFCLNAVFIIATHEVGHALGLQHLHQRADRDRFVTIFDENVTPGFELNFIKQNESLIEDLGVPYDYGSALHYSPTDFSIDKSSKYTMIPKDMRYLKNTGQRSELTFYDSMIINRAYCNSTCSDSTLKCSNGGYPDPANCSRCRCSDLWEGDLCDNIRSGSAGCNPSSGEIPPPTDTEPVCVNSPNYQPKRQSHYSMGDSCTWFIKVPAGCSIEMWIQDDGQWPRVIELNGDVCAHWVEIRAEGPGQQIGERLCGLRDAEGFKYLENQPLIANATTVPVTFRAPEQAFDYNWAYMLGFTLCYRIKDADCLVTTAQPTSTTTSKEPTSTTTSTESTSTTTTTEPTTTVTTKTTETSTIKKSTSISTERIITKATTPSTGANQTVDLVTQTLDSWTTVSSTYSTPDAQQTKKPETSGSSPFVQHKWQLVFTAICLGIIDALLQ